MNGLNLEELHQKLKMLQVQRQKEELLKDDASCIIENMNEPYNLYSCESDQSSTIEIIFDKKAAQPNLSINNFDIYTTLGNNFFIYSQGTGTFGRVKLVKIKGQQDNYYALKMMKKTEIVKLKQVDHIKSEKNILQVMNHPFLVSLRTSFQDKKYVYMLFEFIQGGELFSRLRKDGRFSNDMALFYICEIYSALSYLHQKNIIYRDLKPENLLIDKEGHVQIADFGFAKQMMQSRTYTLCGTPEYLAPEIIQGANVGYGKSVDWWALGVLIFEMLSGHPPFYDNDPIGIYRKILNGVIEFPPFFSLRAKDIIRKLLNPSVEKRLGFQDPSVIKEHKWFRGVVWEDILNKEVPPPWIPQLKGVSDVSCFEKYPDSQEQAKELPRDLEHLFEDF